MIFNRFSRIQSSDFRMRLNLPSFPLGELPPMSAQDSTGALEFVDCILPGQDVVDL